MGMEFREEDVYTVQRPVYCLREFDQEFMEKREETSLRSHAEKFKRNLQRNCTPQQMSKRLISFVPFFSIMRSYYRKSFLFTDIIAGITLAIFHIPQGLAYGLLAGLPPIYGLYTSFFPPLVYVFFGTSRHLSTGTFSLLSLIVAEPVKHVTAAVNESEGLNETLIARQVEVAIAVTCFAGIIQVVMGLLHLGIITSYLSDALVSGLTTGAAVHVFTSQVVYCLGISEVPRFGSVGKIVMIYINIFSRIHTANVATVIITITCIVILIVVKEFVNPKVKEKIKVPVPIELILVILAALISYFCQFESSFNVAVVGEVPRGLPKPVVPNFSLFSNLFSDAFSLAIVCFVISGSLTKMIATKLSYDVDYNQELFALGLMNIGGSIFNCHMAGGNLTRNSIMLDMGMKSQQIANLVSCALMLLILLFAGHLFTPLPKAVLGAIIMVALKGMFKQVTQLRRLWHVSIYDFLIWLVSCLAVIFLDITYGLIAGFAFSILTIVFRTQNPECRLMGRIPQTDIYKDVSKYQVAKEIPGIKIFRFDGAVYFANAERFKTNLFKYTGLDPKVLKAKKAKMDAEAEVVVPAEAEKPSKSFLVSNEAKKYAGLYIKNQNSRNSSVAAMNGRSMEQLAQDAERPKEGEQEQVQENLKPTKENENASEKRAEQPRNPPPPITLEMADSLEQHRFEVTTPSTPKLGTPQRPPESGPETSAPSTPSEVHHVILDCSTWAYIDSVGIRVLKEVIAQYKEVGISVYMAVLKASVREMFARTKLYRTHDKNYMYLTVHDAVLSALNENHEAKEELLCDRHITLQQVRMDTILKYNMSPLPEND